MSSAKNEDGAGPTHWEDPGFASEMLALTSTIAATSTAEAVLGILEHARDLVRADQAIFASFMREDEAGESFRFLVAGDPRWCLAYRKTNWFSSDAWLQYAMRHSEPVCDSEVPLCTPQQEQARQLASQYGVASALIVPAPATGSLARLGVLMLGSSLTDHFRAPAVRTLKLLARALAMELHEWWVRHIRQELLELHRLSKEDLQLLNFELQGLSTKQIARALGVSPASIDSRFQRINAKFRTPNRKAAARLATQYDLIP